LEAGICIPPEKEISYYFRSLKTRHEGISYTSEEVSLSFFANVVNQNHGHKGGEKTLFPGTGL
jgi:hypothetical protein